MAADDAAARLPGRPPARSLSIGLQTAIVLVAIAVAATAFLLSKARSAHEASAEPGRAPVGRGVQPFTPTPAQFATFEVRTVEMTDFRVEHATEGKLAVDDDQTTFVFSPYAGRVIRLLAKAGEPVMPGQVLFTIEATDMVQAQNDLLAANGAVNKARSQLQLAQTIEKRQHDLFDAKAIALKEWQAAQNDLVTAQNDMRASEGALEAVRNRLAILGKSEKEVAAFLQSGRMSPETPIYSPIAGTVIQRKIGPGQYVTAGSGDPAYTVGDLSHLWVLANVRESEAPRIVIGQPVRFRVLAFPNRTFAGKVTYVASAIDPATRRVQVRAEVDNKDGLLKPEMFANVRIATGGVERSPSVPREAVIYEADTARVWVVKPDKSVELRTVTTGLVSGGMLQITSGLEPGEEVVTKGSLFIDRLASGDTL